MRADRRALLPLLLGVAVTWLQYSWITMHRVGPRWFWASDLCPDPYFTCGVVPIGLIFSALVGTGVALALNAVIERPGTDIDG